jgi:DNA-binding FrmR family transcriptional regulator
MDRLLLDRCRGALGLSIGAISRVVEVNAMSGNAMPLRVLNEAFVPDERKGDIRARLKRLRGQIDGVERMLDANRPCLDILTQVAAAQQAMRGVGKLVVRNYLERCASQAIKSGREQEIFEELMEIVFKLTR